ncbi:MAG TPA: 6-phosphogluconolactonase [Opitutae bacterium]|nr:6-phosphogluconolactonase [Opitutae bacterium]
MLFTSTAQFILRSFLSIPLIGCASTFNVYFGTSGDGGIQHAIFNTASGELSAITKVAEANKAGFIAIHPNQSFLYSTALTENPKDKGLVKAYSINHDKTLTKLNQQSSEGTNPCHVSVDATGQMLMVANYMSDASVAAYKINPDGSLETSQSVHTHEGSGAHPKRQTSPHPHSIFPNPANTFAYSPDLGTDHVEIYALNPKAASLTPVGNAIVPGGSKGPRHMKFSHDGRFAYVLNELTMEITTYAADSITGALNYIETVSTLKDRSDIARMSCSEIRIHPNGKYVYNGNRDLLGNGRDALSVFERDEETGRLTLLQNEPARVWVPRNFNITPDGNWLIAGGQNSNNLSTFKLNPNTGLLTAHGDTIAFDGSPICIEFIK